jgi:hypothetical protein
MQVVRKPYNSVRNFTGYRSMRFTCVHVIFMTSVKRTKEVVTVAASVSTCNSCTVCGWVRYTQSLRHPQVTQPVKRFPAFYERRASLPCSQEPATGPYPKPDESGPCSIVYNPSLPVHARIPCAAFIMHKAITLRLHGGKLYKDVRCYILSFPECKFSDKYNNSLFVSSCISQEIKHGQTLYKTQ